ncbi:MAG: glycine cleavage T C-terminal barrel domain-containing protein, partial [Gammaproteobacteria bacterium]
MGLGHRTLARSFKYHRPRGVLSLANHDANVLLETAERTNIRADVEAPSAGAAYRAVNTVGGVRHDLAAALGVLAPVLPVGFYYKAFYRPRAVFPWFERLVRRVAGLGRVSPTHAAARLPRRRRFCDVLVVGAGAAGLAAAEALAEAGLDVVLTDENARPGGSLTLTGDAAAAAQLDAASVFDRAGIELRTGHVAAGFYGERSVPLVGPAGIVEVEARAVILATGTYEQPAVFVHNDAPGVMLSGAAARLVHRYAVTPCERGCVLAGNDAAYDTALDLAAAGVDITAILDLDDLATRGDGPARALGAGIQIVGRVRELAAQRRRGELAAVSFTANGAQQQIECDGLLMQVGCAPAAGLLVQAGGRLRYSQALSQHVPSELPPGVFAAGSINGHRGLEARTADGRAAAAEVLDFLGRGAGALPRPPTPATAGSHPWPIHADGRSKAFVDFDEDLTVGDLTTAFREGFDSAQLMKRYSTIGMGPSQGKTSNVNGLRVLARLRGEDVGSVGATTPRPFTHPVAMGALAGRRVRREWRTALDDWHRAAGATMGEAGAWLRPMYYGAEQVPAVAREYRAVREAAGIIDVSTLGKVELFGPDVDRLLEYAYTCRFGRLAVGMTRYVFMVDGGGTLIDDGVAARLAPDHVYVTTTSSQARTVVKRLRLNAVQLGLDVDIVDRTLAVGAVNLAGPAARSIMQTLGSDAVDDDAFPYLGVRETAVAGLPARVMRVGFVGETGFEIHLDWHRTPALWAALLEAGQAHGIAAFGVEAQRLLRLEKGHLIVGQDTDGTTTPWEVGLGWGVALGKERFHGRHALARLQETCRRTLVGFECTEPAARAIAPCHLVIDGATIAGRVTSVGDSPHRNAVIGLALVDQALAERGAALSIRLGDGEVVAAELATLPFYDPGNTRQKAAAV